MVAWQPAQIANSMSNVMIVHQPRDSAEGGKLAERKLRLNSFSGIYDTPNTHFNYVIYKLQINFIQLHIADYDDIARLCYGGHLDSTFMAFNWQWAASNPGACDPPG